MNELLFPQWRNHNEQRKYPFSDIATLVNDSLVTLHHDLFDDARIYPIGGDETLYLSQIDLSVTELAFTVGTENNPAIASGSTVLPNPSDEIKLLDNLGRPAGVLVTTVLKMESLLGTYGEGSIVFQPDQTPFAPSVIVPTPQTGVQGFILDDGTLLTGNVILIGTDGVVLTMDDGNIRVDIVGDPYAQLKKCLRESVPVETYCGIRTINGIGPDSRGDFKISIGSGSAADNVLRIEQDEGRLKLKAVGNPGTN